MEPEAGTDRSNFTTSPRAERRSWLGLLFLYLVGALMVYHRILTTPMVQDDRVLLARLPLGPVHMWTDMQIKFFRPVIGLSLWIDHAVWGLNPLGYHLSNVLTHALNSFLVAVVGFLLLHALGLDRLAARLAAALGGALFLVLPSHTEAVAWISGRTDVIAAFWCLASFCAYLIGRETRRPLYFRAALLLFCVALLAKESTVGYPFILLGVEMFGLKTGDNEPRETRIRRVIPFFVTLALYVLVRRLALGQLIGGHGAAFHLSLAPRILIQTLVDHVGSAFAPVSSQSLFLGLMTLLAAALAVIIVRRGPAASAACLLLTLFALSLLPVINMDHARHGEQERFIYFPSVFSTLLIALLFSEVTSRRTRWVTFAAAGGMVVAFGWSLNRSCQGWEQAGRLTERVVESVHSIPANRLVVLIAPRSLRAASMLGTGLDCAPALYGWSSPRTILVWANVTLQDPADRVYVQQEGDIYRMKLVGAWSHPGNQPFHTHVAGRLLSPLELTAHRIAYAHATGHALGSDWAGVRAPALMPGDTLAVYTCARIEPLTPLRPRRGE